MPDDFSLILEAHKPDELRVAVPVTISDHDQEETVKELLWRAYLTLRTAAL